MCSTFANVSPLYLRDNLQPQIMFLSSVTKLWLAVLLLSQRQADEIRCTYQRRDVCTDTGCKRVPVSSEYLLIPSLENLQDAAFDKKSVQLRRCDNQGCSPFDLVPEMDGLYIDVPKGGYIFKILWSGSNLTDGRRGDFIEVATLFLTSIVYRGHCAVEPLKM
jgi:hypothetical protein